MRLKAWLAPAILLSTIYWLTSCSAALDSSAAVSSNGHEKTANLEEAAEGDQTLAANLEEAAAEGDQTLAANLEQSSIDVDLTLVAELPEHEIYFYGKEPEGVDLKIGEHTESFDWVYMTPRMIPPMMQVYDVDMDGEDELAIVLSTGSGTGVSLTELHIIEFDASGNIEDYRFAEDDYLAQIGSSITFSINSQSSADSQGSADLRSVHSQGSAEDQHSALAGKITIGSNSYEVDLTEYDTEEYGKLADHLLYGNIVDFNIVNDSLTVELAIGIGVDNFVEPIYIGRLQADVHYHDHAFQLSNYRFHLE